MLGYADQHYARALSPELPARELVALQLGLHGSRRATRLTRADEVIDIKCPFTAVMLWQRVGGWRV